LSLLSSKKCQRNLSGTLFKQR